MECQLEDDLLHEKAQVHGIPAQVELRRLHDDRRYEEQPRLGAPSPRGLPELHVFDPAPRSEARRPGASERRWPNDLLGGAAARCSERWWPGDPPPDVPLLLALASRRAADADTRLQTRLCWPRTSSSRRRTSS